MSKHTPGPWFHDKGHVFVDSRSLVCCGRPDRRSGECCGNPETDGEYDLIAECSPSNAMLIAAAPDMLAAAKLAIDTMPSLKGPAYKALCDAIAKAEGR